MKVDQVILCLVTLTTYTVQVHAGISCMHCNNEDDPESCRDTTICGDEEICYTEEYKDHKGRRSYRLGCVAEARCNLYLDAKGLFGKRDSSSAVPKEQCYQCCSTDECNADLCEDSLGTHNTSMSYNVTTQPPAINGMTCYDCKDEVSPIYCRHTTTCGQGEICFIEEYNDHKGLQAFRMGCANQMRCALYMDASKLFGKRDVPASAAKCFACCSKDECNSGYCHEAVPGLQTTTPQAPVGCHLFKDYCYYFSPQYLTWEKARSYCQAFGADLLSIHSKEENNFLISEMHLLKGPFTGHYFWTAGMYSHTRNVLEWVDGTPFNYSNWYPGDPRSSYSAGTVYNILLGNSVADSYFNTYSMVVRTYSVSSGFRPHIVCKKHQ